jgi:MFS transporter, DHA2 family, multidrug resistance protein
LTRRRGAHRPAIEFHQVQLVSHTAPDNPIFQDQVDALAQRLADAGLGAYEGRRQAFAWIYRMVQSQAQALAYVDVFWILAAMAAIMLALSVLLKKNDPGAAASVPAG